MGLTPVNAAPITGTQSGPAALSEEGLAGGNPDNQGSSDTVNTKEASGQFTISDADGDKVSLTLSGPGGMKLYVNGALVGRDPFTGSFASIRNGKKNRLGRDNWSEDDRLNRPDTAGRMDAIAVWNRELTPAEIAECLKRPHTGTEPGLVGWWTFDDGTPRDQSPQGHSGRLVGSARIDPAPPPFAGPPSPPPRFSRSLGGADGRPLGRTVL